MANNRELSQFASTVGHNGGSIGIGTDNPLQKLHLLDTTSANIYLQTHNAGTGSTAGVYFRTSDSSTADGFFKTAIVLEDDGTSWARGKLHFLQNNTGDTSNATIDDSVLVINNNGNIGINESTPNFHLDVNGNIAIREGQVLTWHDGSGNKAGDIYMDSSDNFVIRNTSSVTERFRIHGDGEVECKGGAAGQNALLVTGNYSSGNNVDIQTWQRTGGAVQAKIGYKDADTSMFFGTDTAHSLAIMTGGTEKLRITSAGDIGIGIDSPAYSLDLGESSSTIRLVSENNGTAIRIGAGGGGNDVSLIRIDGNSVNNGHHGESDNSAYGFSLKYMGSRSGNNNSLSIFADNQTGTQFEALTIQQDGSFGINETAPLGKLHVKTGDSGTSSVGASADELVIEGSGHAGMTILSGNNQQGIINFGEVDDNNIGGITYNHGDNDLLFRTSNAERIRITSVGHLLYDTNKGGIYNFDKACSANASTNIFRVDNEHGAHCFTIYMTGSNSGNSVSKIYNVACKYGSAPTISSAADTGAYGSNNFSLTGSVSGKTHTFAISITGSAATVACTVVLGSMNTSATVDIL